MSIYIETNGFDENVNELPLTDVEVGTAFMGSVNDTDGDEQTGLFIRTRGGVVFLEDLDIQFDTFEEGDDEYYVPKVRNFVEADITITIDGVNR
jgi:hypothetical protein